MHLSNCLKARKKEKKKQQQHVIKQQRQKQKQKVFTALLISSLRDLFHSTKSQIHTK